MSDAPEPVAFVSWELGDPALFGIGGAATPGKRFVGFVSDDPRVVEELIAALDSGGGRGGLQGPQGVRAPVPTSSVGDLLSKVRSLDPSGSGAGEGAVVVPVGRGDAQALALALALAAKEGRHVVFVDRGAEGVLASPYGDWRGDDANRPNPDRLFDVDLARREGRSEAIVALEAATALGVEAGAWFPTAAGGAGLAEALRRFGGSMLVVPSSARRPSFAERLRGMGSDRLARLDIPVVYAD